MNRLLLLGVFIFGSVQFLSKKITKPNFNRFNQFFHSSVFSVIFFSGFLGLIGFLVFLNTPNYHSVNSCYHGHPFLKNRTFYYPFMNPFPLYVLIVSWLNLVLIMSKDIIFNLFHFHLKGVTILLISLSCLVGTYIFFLISFILLCRHAYFLIKKGSL
jgi:membrane-anchored protein YejM (alkaline phosphatase superfamily)